MLLFGFTILLFMAEVEYDQAWGCLIGPEGRGVATIIEMVVHTRLDCALGSAGLMRQAVRSAVHHARHRSAFGTVLAEAPLMQAVLADLALESEVAVLLSLQLAAWFDECEISTAPAGVHRTGHPHAHAADPARIGALRRLATAVAKYLICKRAPGHLAEALECHGGNGFDQLWVVERWYRQAPLNSIWEGSGNVQCLDILRTCVREEAALPALLDELRESAPACGPCYTALLSWVEGFAGSVRNGSIGRAASEAGARVLAESLGVLLQAHVLTRKGDAAMLALFCDTRLPSHNNSGDTTALSGPNRSYGAFSASTSHCQHVLARQAVL